MAAYVLTPKSPEPLADAQGSEITLAEAVMRCLSSTRSFLASRDAAELTGPLGTDLVDAIGHGAERVAAITGKRLLGDLRYPLQLANEHADVVAIVGKIVDYAMQAEVIVRERMRCNCVDRLHLVGAPVETIYSGHRFDSRPVAQRRQRPVEELELGDHLVHRLIALLDVFGHRLVNDRRQLHRQQAVEAVDGRRLELRDLLQDIVDAALECSDAGEDFVKHGAGGKDVTAAVDSLAGDLFGRHVAGRADQRPGRGHGGVRQSGDTEIENANLPVRGQEDIFGLDVAMREAVAMGVGEGAAHLFHDRDAIL